MVDQVVQCKGKAAGDDLLGQDHRQQQAIVVLGFVSGHGAISFAECNAKGVPDTVFLQPQRTR
jgi:S-formylglutathione hydrolase FrmB